MMRLLRFRDLEYFIALADHGSFSRGAEACGITQPTLSSQLRRMEEFLGIALVERRPGAVTLTQEGAEVLAAAREIMETFNRVQRAARGDGVLLGRPLRFGVLPTIAPYFAPRFLDLLAALNGAAGLDLVESRSDALEAAVQSDALDFAVTATVPRVASLAALPLSDEWLVAVSAAPLPPSVPVDGLTGPILLMQEGHCFREVVSEAIRRSEVRRGAGIATRIGPSSFATLLALVRGGHGDTILPEPFVRAGGASVEGLSVALLEPRDEGRQLRLLVRAGRERYRDVCRIAEVAREALAATPAPAQSMPTASYAPGRAARAPLPPVTRVSPE